MLHVSVHSYVRVTEMNSPVFFTVRVENIYTRFSSEREAIPLFLHFSSLLSRQSEISLEIRRRARKASPNYLFMGSVKLAAQNLVGYYFTSCSRTVAAFQPLKFLNLL